MTEKERRCENVMEKEKDGAQGNYEPRKDAGAKTDNNTESDRGRIIERRTSKDKTQEAISYPRNISQRKFAWSENKEESARIRHHPTESSVYEKVVSRKFQVSPVNWRLTLCSVAVSARRFRTVRSGLIFPRGREKNRIICAGPVRDLVINNDRIVGTVGAGIHACQENARYAWARALACTRKRHRERPGERENVRDVILVTESK